MIGCSACEKKAPRTNIVLIVIDTLRADHLPIYNYPRNTTPFLARLAARGVIFENAYSASSWTSPATASIFSSLYPFQHGVHMGLMAQRKLSKKDPNVEFNRLPAKVVTMTEILKQSGYATYGVSDNINISDKQGFDQGFDVLESFIHEGAEKIKTVARTFKNRIGASPYFLYLHFNDPHQPYRQEPPKELLTGDETENIVTNYDWEISHVDRRIQELYEFYGWDKNTLLIITADHGEELWEKGLYGHGKSLYHTLLHVPLVVFFPERIAGGRRVAENVSTIDILPTLCDWVGAKHPAVISGVSFTPVLSGRPLVESKRYFFANLQIKRFEQPDLLIKATIYRHFKFIHSFAPEDRLFFNLQNDPGEKDNQFGQAQETARILENEYLKYESRCIRFKQESANTSLDEKKNRQLEELGYIQK